MDTETIKDYRCERKFLVDQMDVYQVMMTVKLHPAIFIQRYPPRYINNIYFDTKDMSYYHDNVTGAKERRKIRLRWYGDMKGSNAGPVLEFKIKDGFVGTKEHHRLREMVFKDGLPSDYFNETIERSDIPQDVKYLIRDLDPVIANRYHRFYFETVDGRFRITVDEEMSYYNISRFSNNFRYSFDDNRNIIIELKYDKEIDHIASRISQSLPFSVTKNSKYVQGVESVYL